MGHRFVHRRCRRNSRHGKSTRKLRLGTRTRKNGRRRGALERCLARTTSRFLTVAPSKSEQPVRTSWFKRHPRGRVSSTPPTVASELMSLAVQCHFLSLREFHFSHD